MPATRWSSSPPPIIHNAPGCRRNCRSFRLIRSIIPGCRKKSAVWPLEPKAMIKGFEHVGMVTGDMDRSLAFYRDLLGLRLHLRKTMANGTDVAFLDAGGGMLEIFASPGGASRSTDLPAATSGVLHITFVV